MRDLPWECPTGRGRLNELHVEIAEPDEGEQVALQSGERTDDGFEDAAAFLIGDSAQPDQGARCRLDRHVACCAVIEAGRSQKREYRFERDRVPVSMLGDDSGVVGDMLT
ncbi:hypothetical protein GCM10027071_10730 [Microbacterium marinum]